MILHCFDTGICHFDLANNYGPPYGSAEETFGQIYRRDLRPFRQELFISTKAGYDMYPGLYGNWGSRKYLFESLERSLGRMGLDYVDIFYSHRYDPETPLEETMQALVDIVRSGKALYAGISNYPAETARKAYAYLEERDVHCLLYQGKYSMLVRDPEGPILDGAAAHGVGFIAFSPLAQGLLTGKYRKGQPIPEGSRATHQADRQINNLLTDDHLDKVEKLLKVAERLNVPLSVLALAWTLRDPVVSSVITGATKPEQLAMNLQAAELELDAETLKEIEDILQYRPFRRKIG